MLLDLHIRNFAIIDDLRLQFHPGFNVLTGETGAGKSIIFDALGLLLGDRALTEWVRAGSERAEIEATFTLNVPLPGDSTDPATDDLEADLLKFLEQEGLDDPDQPHILTLGREVRLNGRNICRVNGRAVNLQILSDIANRLVDVHGQGEHLSLLRPKSHIHLLDRYAGLLDLRRQLAEQVRRLRTVRSELNRLRHDARTIVRRVDLLRFQTEEIAAAELRVGEDEELENERRRLGNAETLLQLAQTVIMALNEGSSESPGAIDLLGEAVGRLDRLARIDSEMQSTALTGQTLLEQTSDLVRELQDYAENLAFDPERLNEVEERLELIHNLKRKYGETIEDVIAFGERAQAELDELSNWEATTSHLEAEEDELLREIGQLGMELSERRRRAGEEMARQVEAELADLRMAQTRFKVEIVQVEQDDGAILSDGRRVAFDSTGIDRVEFLISANPGEPLKPMAKVASGGETARLMLALKSVLAHADATPTLIFDEIDQGIGGRIGAVVGEKLWRLTGQGAPVHTNGQNPTVPDKRHQVICITHLPHLAAFGDLHFRVDKRIYEEQGETRTTTVVHRLQGAEQVTELMHMLGADSPAGRRSIEEILAMVATIKNGQRTGSTAQPVKLDE